MKNILLVEDDLFLNDITSRKLFNIGFNVISVKNTDEAAETFSQNKIDLLVLDLDLPGQSGSEYLLDLKADERTKNVPVIVFSNNDEPLIAAKSIENGADAFFVKIDTDIDELEAKINQLLV